MLRIQPVAVLRRRPFTEYIITEWPGLTDGRESRRGLVVQDCLPLSPHLPGMSWITLVAFIALAEIRPVRQLNAFLQ